MQWITTQSLIQTTPFIMKMAITQSVNVLLPQVFLIDFPTLYLDLCYTKGSTVFSDHKIRLVLPCNCQFRINYTYKCLVEIWKLSLNSKIWINDL